MSQIERGRPTYQLLCCQSVLSNGIIMDNLLYYKNILNVEPFLPINLYIQ